MLCVSGLDEGYNTPFEGALDVHGFDYAARTDLPEYGADRLACVSEYNFEASLTARAGLGPVAYCDYKQILHVNPVWL